MIVAVPREPRRPMAVPFSETERLEIGGLYRCCTDTWHRAMAEINKNYQDGDTIQCDYTTDSTHQMVRLGGRWRWNH